MSISYDWYLNRYLAERWCYQEDLLSPNECQQIIDYAKTKNLSRGVVELDNKKTVSPVRESNILFLQSSDEALTWLYQKITDSIISLNNSFFRFDIDKIETLQFSEYDSKYKGHYGKHIDLAYNSIHYRKLSFSLQLSEDTDYEGGDLLYHLQEEPAVAIRKQGTINLFPSYTLHEVTPVTKGVRYSLVGWISGAPFK